MLFDKEVQSCQEVLSERLNDELQKDEIQAIFIAEVKDIYVGKTSLRVRIAVESISDDRNIETLRDVVQRCVNGKLPNCFVENGKITSW